MAGDERDPTTPMAALERGARLVVELDDTKSVAEFFAAIAELLRRPGPAQRRLTIIVD